MLIQPQMFPQRSVFIHGHDARQRSERRGSGFSGGYRLIAFDGRRQHAHASCRYPVRRSDKCIHMIFQDVPGDRIRFAAGKAGHDRDHVAVYDADLSVPGCSAFVQAGSGLRLHDDHFGRIVRITVGKISLDCPGKRSYAGLDEYMGRTLAVIVVELLVRLHCHGAVSLHDPGRDLLVAVPYPCMIQDGISS